MISAIPIVGEGGVLRSIAAVIGSYLLSVVLVILTDPLLSRIFPGEFEKGRVPSERALIASTGFFFVVSILCAWVCARFSREHASRNVLWFLGVGEVMGLVATFFNWGNGWPHWYLIAWLIVWPVGCWLGLLLNRRPVR